MRFRHNPRIRALIVLLLLAIGPLKAHAVYTCEMMGVSMHDICCCGEHQEPAHVGHDVSPDLLAESSSPCCEQSAALSIDEETRQGSPIVKPPDLPSDLDPPDVMFAIIDVAVDQIPLAVRSAERYSHLPPWSPGSTIWLSTRRLRI